MKLNCKDLACPQPVLELKKALEALTEDGIIELELNSVSSVENCRRFALSQGCTEESQLLPEGITLMKIVKGFGCDLSVEKKEEALLNRTLFIKTDRIGNGELGKKLMNGFLKTTLEFEALPKYIIFVNEGVLLTTQPENSDIIGSLRSLSARGVTIYSCGLCLNALEIDPSSLQVGEIGNAYDTMRILLSTDVVSL
ncbi:MAG TPA: sulfurtransferase-like selenium metabolism protein YedF [Sulfuricurvum sp.]|nr:sulfurtransferase-like selenium metabolism protein YedF [Sulfuricurvum sp.]